MGGVGGAGKPKSAGEGAAAGPEAGAEARASPRPRCGGVNIATLQASDKVLAKSAGMSQLARTMNQGLAGIEQLMANKENVGVEA
jgi:hypothetical protein